jgi:hypothetical protein
MATAVLVMPLTLMRLLQRPQMRLGRWKRLLLRCWLHHHHQRDLAATWLLLLLYCCTPGGGHGCWLTLLLMMLLPTLLLLLLPGSPGWQALPAGTRTARGRLL